MPPETEAQLHQNIVDYLKLKYPEAIFRTDFAAGLKLSMAQATKHSKLQKSRAFPDLFIAEPRRGFHGLFIELKREGTQVQTKNGNWVSNKHIQEQALMLHSLGSRGYMATFGIGWDHTIGIIDEYLALEKPNYKPPEYSVEFPKPKTKEADDGLPF